MNRRLIFASLTMVGLTFGVGCGPSEEMGESQQQEQLQAPAQDSTAATRPADEAGTVRAQVVGDRGGLFDAAWGDCAP